MMTLVQPSSEAATGQTVACVEIGGGGIQTVLLGPGTGAQGNLTVLEGASSPEGMPLLIASPGLVAGRTVLAASNLGWFGVDPAAELGLTEPVTLLRNDAHAAAIGEWALRQEDPEAPASLVYLGLGTGVGAAVVIDGRAIMAPELGHTGRYGTRTCSCGRVGCLETVAGGWALSTPITPAEQAEMVAALADAVRTSTHAKPTLVVVAGGVVRRYPRLVEKLAAALPDRRVEGTRAPATVKSASAWGLRHAWDARTSLMNLSA